jgi:hypothetical protein
MATGGERGREDHQPADGRPSLRVLAAVGAVVLAGRCLEQRVTSVTLTSADTAKVVGADATPLWRVESAKGSIERSYVIGGAPPDGFREATGLVGRPAGPVQVVVTFSRLGHPSVQDARVVDLDALRASAGAGGDGPAAMGAVVACGAKAELGLTTVLFGSGALAVVVTYAAMVRRRWSPR